MLAALGRLVGDLAERVGDLGPHAARASSARPDPAGAVARDRRRQVVAAARQLLEGAHDASPAIASASARRSTRTSLPAFFLEAQAAALGLDPGLLAQGLVIGLGLRHCGGASRRLGFRGIGVAPAQLVDIAPG
jgi:hypothetical protein